MYSDVAISHRKDSRHTFHVTPPPTCRASRVESRTANMESDSQYLRHGIRGGRQWPEGVQWLEGAHLGHKRSIRVERVPGKHNISVRG